MVALSESVADRFPPLQRMVVHRTGYRIEANLSGRSAVKNEGP
jgi:hypothetical protein